MKTLAKKNLDRKQIKNNSEFSFELSPGIFRRSGEKIITSDPRTLTISNPNYGYIIDTLKTKEHHCNNRIGLILTKEIFNRYKLELNIHTEVGLEELLIAKFGFEKGELIHVDHRLINNIYHIFIKFSMDKSGGNINSENFIRILAEQGHEGIINVAHTMNRDDFIEFFDIKDHDLRSYPKMKFCIFQVTNYDCNCDVRIINDSLIEEIYTFTKRLNFNLLESGRKGGGFSNGLKSDSNRDIYLEMNKQDWLIIKNWVYYRKHPVEAFLYADEFMSKNNKKEIKSKLKALFTEKRGKNGYKLQTIFPGMSSDLFIEICLQTDNWVKHSKNPDIRGILILGSILSNFSKKWGNVIIFSEDEGTKITALIIEMVNFWNSMDGIGRFRIEIPEDLRVRFSFKEVETVNNKQKLMYDYLTQKKVKKRYNWRYSYYVNLDTTWNFYKNLKKNLLVGISFIEAPLLQMSAAIYDKIKGQKSEKSLVVGVSENFGKEFTSDLNTGKLKLEIINSKSRGLMFGALVGTGNLATQGFDLLIFFKISGDNCPYIRLIEGKLRGNPEGSKISIMKLMLGTGHPAYFYPLNHKGSTIIGDVDSRVARDYMRLNYNSKLYFMGASIQAYTGSAQSYDLCIGQRFKMSETAQLFSVIIDLLSGKSRPIFNNSDGTLNFDPTLQMITRPVNQILGLLNDYLYSFFTTSSDVDKWLRENYVVDHC